MESSPSRRSWFQCTFSRSFLPLRTLYKLFDENKRAKVFNKTSGVFQHGGHFAGIMLNANNIDFSRHKYHIPGPAGFGGTIMNGEVEAVLANRAKSLGVEIYRGVGVSRCVDEGDGVKVWAGDQRFTAQWLMGCDGERSMIRMSAGFEFVGTEGEFTGYVAKCEFDRPEILTRGFTRTETGLYIKFGDDTEYVIDFSHDLDRTKEITREQYQEALRRVSGTDITVKTLHMASSFTDRSKQVMQYRKGPLLLAGDSAHIRSPLGAQGLNTSIGDAMNLGWKHAAVVS